MQHRLAMDLFELKQEEIDLVRTEFGLDEQSIKEKLKCLRDWLNMQPHLPHNCDDSRLERWIIICKNSLERAKSSIDLYYTMKNLAPELLTGRDPRSEWYQNIITIGRAGVAPCLTERGYRIVIADFTDPDAENYNLLHIFRVFMMIGEIVICEDYNAGIIGIVNLEVITMRHVLRVSLPLLRKLQLCLFKAMRMRLKKLIFVSTPPFAEILVEIIKSGLSSKLASRIHFCPKGINPTEEISPKLLPAEFGGENGSMNDMYALLLKKMDSYRDWFLEQDKYKADESKRPGKPLDSGELFGFDGSFRQLNYD